ncbi:MAG: ATP-binding protein [Bacteroidota bacterium]
MKQIERNDIGDIKKCADEPIHLPGALQDFGTLIGFDRKRQSLAFYGTRFTDWFRLSHKQLVDCCWHDLAKWLELPFDDEMWRKLLRSSSVLPHYFHFNNASWVAHMTQDDDYVIVEFEPCESTPSSASYFEGLSNFIQQSNSVSHFYDFSRLFAHQLREITGYDRVMVYQFDENFNGEVFAESKMEELEAFEGLHYPHTDIPAQARALYKKKLVRTIPDVHAEEQPLVKCEDALTASDIDLSQCYTRGVSPIHIEYLKNMGVSATLTLSIVIEEQLWGLVACHHHSPRHIDSAVRRDALLQTELFSGQIRRWEAAEDFNNVQEKEHIFQSIVEQIEGAKDKFQTATASIYFTGLTESTGGAILANDKIYRIGDTPEDADILAIQSYMKLHEHEVFSSHQFSREAPFAKAFERHASGLLYFSLDAASNSAIMWFRQELSEGKKWGGKPNLSGEKRLTPRSSFAAWEEEVAGKSSAWKSYQIQAGLRLGAYLEKEIFITNLKRQKQQLERLTQQLQSKNDELSQFNWLSSHDMKEPLRKIRLFIDQIFLEDDRLSAEQRSYFDRIAKSAERMQELIADLLDYAQLSGEELKKRFSLNELMDELAELFEERDGITIRCGKLPELVGVRFQFKQVFQNLISNSLKFKKPDEQSIVQINATTLAEKEREIYALNKQQRYVKINYVDNGIGFDPAYNERIFEVFQRLHRTTTFEGTGIGLAICKKIIEAHGGMIRANGEPDQGATFTIILPIPPEE